MSLEQAAGAGLAESAAAAASAERGIDWALDRLYEGPGWRAFAGEGDGQFGSGASALLTAALVLRRERTGDERYDDVLHDLGAFLTAMVNERGQVYGQYDRAAGAVGAGQLEQVLHRRGVLGADVAPPGVPGWRLRRRRRADRPLHRHRAARGRGVPDPTFPTTGPPTGSP